MKMPSTFSRNGRRAVLASCAAALTLLGGCASLSTWLPSWITSPSWPWSRGTPKLGPLPPFEAKATARVNWEVPLGNKASAGFAPAITGDTIYAASPNGELVSVDSATGRQTLRSGAGKPLSGGIGADAGVLVVGTDKAEVLAFDAAGKPLWEAKVSSEVAGPPRIAEGIAVVWSLDGRIFGFSTADGSRKWVVQRTSPPLIVRRFPGGVITRGGLFAGTAGGKLLAIDLARGVLGWEANVSSPKGATELERLVDITSLPVVDAREVCAAAYLGRVACFDLARGSLVWSRDFGSLGGIALDNRYLYITDDKGSIQALDKSTGASVWKQDKLMQRMPSGPVVMGDYLGVVDGEGYLHVLDRNDGQLVGRTATDGEPPLSQPVAVSDAAVWQSASNLISASAN
jgi:outer membrane protein assembly factor BamB